MPLEWLFKHLETCIHKRAGAERKLDEQVLGSLKYTYLTNSVNSDDELNSHSITTRIVVQLAEELPGKIVDVPEMQVSIGRFTHLTSLVASDCRLECIPWSFVYLKSLNLLDLSFNLFTQLPRYICYLESLEYLYLGNNKLVALPPNLLMLSRLQVLDVSNNETLIFPTYEECLAGCDAIMRILLKSKNRKNVWENSKQYYIESGTATSSVEPLFHLSVQCILHSELDYLNPMFVPPKLKSFLLLKEKEEACGIQVAKCENCKGCFSNRYLFRAHRC